MGTRARPGIPRPYTPLPWCMTWFPMVCLMEELAVDTSEDLLDISEDLLDISEDLLDISEVDTPEVALAMEFMEELAADLEDLMDLEDFKDARRCSEEMHIWIFIRLFIFQINIGCGCPVLK